MAIRRINITQEAQTMSLPPDAVAEPVQWRLPMRTVRSYNPSRVKLVIYKFDTCYTLPSLALDINRIGQGLVSSVPGRYDSVGHGVGGLRT